jgi:hypothetical protein
MGKKQTESRSGQRLLRPTLRRTFVVIVAIVSGFLIGPHIFRRTDERLMTAASVAITKCVTASSAASDPTSFEFEDLQRREPHAITYDNCVKQVSADAQFQGLRLVAPSDQLNKLRKAYFSWWKCVENAGYRRTTEIPLAFNDGYPLAVKAGHFDVPSTNEALYKFHEVAAKCGGRSVDSLTGPRGELSRDKADGENCTEHAHGQGRRHSHGCYSTPTYPPSVEG